MKEKKNSKPRRRNLRGLLAVVLHTTFGHETLAIADLKKSENCLNKDDMCVIVKKASSADYIQGRSSIYEKHTKHTYVQVLSTKGNILWVHTDSLRLVDLHEPLTFTIDPSAKFR
jgi:hypothetical protein